MLGPGARDGDVHVGEQRLDLRRPAGLDARHRLQRPPGAALPPLPRQVADGAGGRAGDEAGHVVPGPGEPVRGGTAAQLVPVEVLGGVPAVGRDVDAAGEGQAVVDDHDLLVVRAADRVVGVHGHPQPVGSPPVEQHDRRQPAAERADDAVVPDQDADLELRVGADGLLQHPAQLVRPPSVLPPSAGPARVHPDPRVEVPADEQHPTLGAQHRAPQHGEVVGRVHEHRVPLGTLDPPARLPRDQQVLGGDRAGTSVGHPAQPLRRT